MKKRNYTTEEILCILKDYRIMSGTKVAQKYGISLPTVTRWARKAGVKKWIGKVEWEFITQSLAEKGEE